MRRSSPFARLSLSSRSMLLGLLAMGATSSLGAGCALGSASDGDGEGAGPPEGSDVQAFTTGPNLSYESYEVLFTNPDCADYVYPTSSTVVANDGTVLTQKPKGAYCSSADGAASGAQATSPQKRLVEWIDAPETHEVFFAYLSFSNRVVEQALCNAIQTRDLKVTMVLDRETDLGAANRVLACQPQDPANAPRLELRGHDATIGFAHNKVFLVNPHEDRVRLVFSSGNLSSGLVTHHENWHFVTVAGTTHFAQAHVCLMEGMLDHYRTKQEYGTFIKQCRDAIPVGEEADLKTFFVPGDGGRAGNSLKAAIRGATSIGMAAHRFGYNVIRTEIGRRLDGQNPPAVRMVVDDDVWWAGHGDQTVLNTHQEYGFVDTLVQKGMSVHYMETNNGANQLHHNKFIVFDAPQGPSAFAGAGNLTGTAFSDNFENFYMISIPSVVQAMADQHAHLYELATPADRLPASNTVRPTRR